MKNLITILVFVIGFNSIHAQSTGIRENDTISFKSTGFNSYREIILLSNNEFIRIENYVSDYGGKSTFKKYYGKYELIDSTLTLKPKIINLRTYTGNPERKTIEEKIDYKPDSKLKITTVFTFIKHNNIQYLIPKKYSLTNLKLEKLSSRTLDLLFQRPLIN